jgi:large-conductance mechanosensitive channel
MVIVSGVVIGIAFQKIISALVNKIFMPIINVLIVKILYFFLRALGQNTETKPQVDDLFIEIRDELVRLDVKIRKVSNL